MAIGYINVTVVSAGRGQSAVGLAAYLCRANWRNPLTGTRHDFAENSADLVEPPLVILPDRVPPKFYDPLELWAQAERAEITIDRKTRLPRFKKDAALAKHVVLALPKEITNAERHDLTLDWAKSQYPGVGVMVTFHKPDDPDTGNFHAHLLVTTRVLTDASFGKKARHLDPRFAGITGENRSYIESQNLPGQWRAFQNDFFRQRGIPLIVDETLAIGGHHWGAARFIKNSDNAADDAAAKAAAREKMLDPVNVVAKAMETRAVFTRQSLSGLLHRHDIDGDAAKDILKRVFADTAVLRLHDPETGEPTRLYTTRAVRDQEMAILDLAEKLTKRRASASRLSRLQAAAARIAPTMTLAGEQLDALTHATGKSGLCIIRGVAGAGKSYTVKAIREAHEAAGYRCVGFAPTNTVAASMKADGFSQSSTLHAERYRQENGKRPHLDWSSKTCVVVDEAGMMDAEMTEWLLRTAAETGAKLVLVGDEAQLTSVSRGGLFGVLKARFGAAELKEVRRQQADWAKAASLALADGRVAEGLSAYDEHGRIHWAEELIGAKSALVAKWTRDHRRQPDVARFVYCATNAAANDLNDLLQQARFGDRDPVSIFESDRGRIALYPTDRVQFHTTDKSLGILNGHIGKVTAIFENEIQVELDGGETVSFDPERFTGWGLGYAGTVYRGQGKTLPQAYALYDSAPAWSARASYVALTRHKEAFDLFVPRSLAKDLPRLSRQMSRRDGADASLVYLTAEEAQSRFPSIPVEVRDDAGKKTVVNASDPTHRESLHHYWDTAPVRSVIATYSAIEKAAKSAQDAALLRSHLADAKRIAARRGFRPWDGRPDPRCLRDYLLPSDKLTYPSSPALHATKEQIDICPVVVEIDEIDYNAWFAIGRRLRELDHSVLDTIVKRLGSIAERIIHDTQLFANVTAATWLVRVSKALKRRAPDGRLRSPHLRSSYLELRAADPISRETRGRLRLWNSDGETIDLFGVRTSHKKVQATIELTANYSPPRALKDLAPLHNYHEMRDDDLQHLSPEERAIHRAAAEGVLASVAAGRSGRTPPPKPRAAKPASVQSEPTPPRQHDAPPSQQLPRPIAPAPTKGPAIER